MENQKWLVEKLFENWAEKSYGSFSGFIIPNVFGPFGNPYYNSVVATFCHQLTHNETPKIHTDSVLKMIYVGQLVKHIMNRIREANKQKDKSVIETVRITYCRTQSIDPAQAVTGLQNDMVRKRRDPQTGYLVKA